MISFFSAAIPQETQNENTKKIDTMKIPLFFMSFPPF
jgi:hypothetical protein